MITLPDAFVRVPIAHRALHDLTHGRPENSRAAIRAAIAAGYGIEIDLQPSRDGQAMVFHDYDLGRLTGASGPIQQRDAAELSGMHLVGGDEGIPSFAEVLELVSGRVPLLVELKDQHGQMGETDGTLERAVAANLAGYNGQVALMSFNPNMVRKLAEIVPDRPRGIVSSEYDPVHWPLLKKSTRARLRGIPDYDAVGACFVSHHWADLEQARLAVLKAMGAVLLCWTIRSLRQETWARTVADNVTFEGYLPSIPG